MTLEEEILKLDLIASDAFEGGDANEFRQLAEWLRELKAYKDGCHCDTCKYLDKNIKNRPCGWCGDNESNWEYGGAEE
jgi:hypothetical protein